MKSSRRKVLWSVVAFAGMAPLALRSLAQAKATKQAMQYQDQPKNGQRCDGCVQYIPGPDPKADGGCKVVEGPISPAGWCIAYVKKG